MRREVHSLSASRARQEMRREVHLLSASRARQEMRREVHSPSLSEPRTARVDIRKKTERTLNVTSFAAWDERTANQIPYRFFQHNGGIRSCKECKAADIFPAFSPPELDFPRKTRKVYNKGVPPVRNTATRKRTVRPGPCDVRHGAGPHSRANGQRMPHELALLRQQGFTLPFSLLSHFF